MDIALLVFDGFSGLDAFGPAEVLVRLPGARLHVVGTSTAAVRTDTGRLTVSVDHALADCPAPDVVVVPGGPGTFVAGRDEQLLAWLTAAHAQATRTLTVCSGSVLLAATGVLVGRRVATSWFVRGQLERFGAVFAEGERFVRDGRTLSAAGSTAGLDAALQLAGELAGPDVARAVQLGLEYDPQPPFDPIDPASAPPQLQALADELGAASNEPRWTELIATLSGPQA